MMKSVLISVKSQYCELIANGKKTIEVRKTLPRIKTPFKCYIYCTTEKHKNKYLHTSNKKNKLLFWNNKGDCEIVCQPENTTYIAYTCSRKVIGEFVCDCIIPISITYSNPESRIALREFPYTCLTDKQIMNYLGNGKEGYGWHISNLVIYDKPKDLSEFYKPCTFNHDCFLCDYWAEKVKVCTIPPIPRPPQSWCYVEEL